MSMITRLYRQFQNGSSRKDLGNLVMKSRYIEKNNYLISCAQLVRIKITNLI